MDAPLDRLQTELQAHADWLARQPGLTGCGIGVDAAGEPAIVVYASDMPDRTKEAIRKQLVGMAVAFEETGEFRAFEE